MKKLLCILLLAFCVPTGLTLCAQAGSLGRLAMVQKYVKKVTSEQFLQAARQADLAVIAQVKDYAVFSATDKFGNNALHLAKNAATVKAIEKAVIQAAGEEVGEEILTQLRNQRNHMNETPVMAHISYGKADTFELLYKGTRLAEAIREVRSVDRGGALTITADIKKANTRALSADKSGRTIAQAALANADKPGMQQIVYFFEANARYLF